MIWDNNGNRKEKTDLKAFSPEKKNIPERDSRLSGVMVVPLEGYGALLVKTYFSRVESPLRRRSRNIV